MSKDIYENIDFNILNSSEFKEDSVREELINPLLKALKYRLSGKNRIIRSKSLSHPIVKIGSGKKHIKIIPDYLLVANGKYAWVLDAKGPNEEIKTGENVEQAYFYAIHPDIRATYYALCNGREFILFKFDEKKAVLYFNLIEIDQYWDKLENILAVDKILCKKKDKEELEKKSDFNYLGQNILPEIKVRKQAAKRHFGVHGYFTKQAWNVVREYIVNFTKPGDVVLDPFGGSGVTFIEALMTGRRGIHLDLNPLSPFLVKHLITPVSINKLYDEFCELEKKYNKNCPKSKKQIKEALKKYKYPKKLQLPKGSDATSIEGLFSEIQLAQLSFLKALILKVRNRNIRNCLLIAFSSSITKFNLTYHPSKSRGANAGDCAAFRYYRYRIAPEPVTLDLWDIFRIKYRKLIAAKNEIQPILDKNLLEESLILKASATELSMIGDESVDYIYTDPPYGSKIPYLDLSIMWNSWLDLKVSEKDFKLEAIEGGERNKSREEYSDLLRLSLKEMFRVLKMNRWMSFVFAHKDPAYWHLIVEAAERLGFEYAGAIKQAVSQSSFKKRQNPFTVLSGQLIINFKKVENPKTIMKVKIGDKIAVLIIETIESTIAKNDGASLEQINDDLIIKGLELGFLDILGKEYKDLSPILLDNFEYNEEQAKFHIKKNNKFKTNIDIHLRVKYFLISYLRRMELQNNNPSFDDIVLYIMPLLKNGETPKNQTILNVLESIAHRIGSDSWRLKKDIQFELF